MTDWPTEREIHDRRCYLLGITDPAKVERAWAESRKGVGDDPG